MVKKIILFVGLPIVVIGTSLYIYYNRMPKIKNVKYFADDQYFTFELDGVKTELNLGVNIQLNYNNWSIVTKKYGLYDNGYNVGLYVQKNDVIYETLYEQRIDTRPFTVTQTR